MNFGFSISDRKAERDIQVAEMKPLGTIKGYVRGREEWNCNGLFG